MLGHVRVGARQQQPVLGELRVGRPHLLAVEHPAVVGALGARLDRREVGAGGRLGEELAPHLVAAQHRQQVALLLLLGAVGDDRRAEHADADDVEDPGHAGGGDLLVGDDLVQRPEALPAELGGPRRAVEAALGQPRLPRAPRGDLLVLVQLRGARVGGRLALVLVEPGPDLGAVLRQLRSVVQVHAAGRYPKVGRATSYS